MTSHHLKQISETLCANQSLLALTAPRTPDQLHAWLRHVAGVYLPREPVLPGSTAPFDYLRHTFFEDRPSGTPRDCVVWACRGGGKTYLGAIATMLDLLFKPGVEVCVLGGSREQSQRLHEHLRKLFDRPTLAPLVDGKITERRLALTNGSACDILAQSHTSVRGRRPQILRCDEVELFKPDVWQAAQLVTRTKRCGETLVHGAVEALSTMHEPGGLMSTLVTDEGGRRVFRWGVVDTLANCPAASRTCDGCPIEPECAGRARHAHGHIRVEDAISMKRRCAEPTWESEMLCLRPSREHLVFPEFNRATHTARFEMDRDDRSLEWIAGMDFGFRAPTVILWAVHDPGDNTLRIIDEHARAEMILADHIETITKSRWPKPRWIGADPAGRQRSDQTGVSPAQQLRKAGLTVRDRPKSIHEGVLAIRARLQPASGPPTLIIHERCEQLIKSLETLHYSRDNPHDLTPVKDGPDHAADALRYLVVSLDCVAGAKGFWC